MKAIVLVGPVRIIALWKQNQPNANMCSCTWNMQRTYNLLTSLVSNPRASEQKYTPGCRPCLYVNHRDNFFFFFFFWDTKPQRQVKYQKCHEHNKICNFCPNLFTWQIMNGKYMWVNNSIAYNLLYNQVEIKLWILLWF